MPNEQDFLRKHYSAGDADAAVQTALTRLAGSPAYITTSSVIHGIAWTDLLNRMFIAVINADGRGAARADLGADPDGMAYAIRVVSKQHGEQWNIVLTGIDYVDVTRKGAGSSVTYETSKYRNGNVFITARAVKDEPGLLGEVVHLTTGFGSPEGSLP
ncbi:hypothetical protein GGR77_003404 [Xanthomonas translucens]